MMKTALITGVTGQDGSYLAELLLSKGYFVVGVKRRTSLICTDRIDHLLDNENFCIVYGSMDDSSNMYRVIQEYKPDEIYNLAGVSSVLEPFKNTREIAQVNGFSVLIMLETIRQFYPKTKFFQASSSEMFAPSEKLISENSPFEPNSPYAISKVFAHQMTIQYRQNFHLFCCCGILFNHESPIRGLEFVTRKITNAAAQIKLGLKKDISIGNLNSKRDWGYAPEYMEAIHLMMQQDKPGTYVISTNETYSVEEMAKTAFETVGLDWKDHVKTDKKFLRPLDIHLLRGDYSKAKKELDWAPSTSFDDLVKMMVESDINNAEKEKVLLKKKARLLSKQAMDQAVYHT